MKIIFPEKLKGGDEVRVIAPSCSAGTVDARVLKSGVGALESLGLRVTFSNNLFVRDRFGSSPVHCRLEDLHEAFLDKKVKAIFAVRGGFNSNSLLEYIDWDLIRGNAKIFCGFSDITALQNAILTKSGIVTYSGPNCSSLATAGEVAGYTLEYLTKCLFEKQAFSVEPSLVFRDSRKAAAEKGLGWLPVYEGVASGRVVGGNLCTLNLLQGTKYFPGLKNSILFLEDDHETPYYAFDRDLQSLLQVVGFSGVGALVLGRFQKASGMTKQRLKTILKSRPQLQNIPIIANVDFGHTDPKIVFPIGGIASVSVSMNPKRCSIQILKH